MTPLFSLGLETGYTYLDNNETRLRADDFNRPVEYFTVKSSHLITLNAVFGFNIHPDISFNLFAGPAWLNTHYIDTDIANRVTRTAPDNFQLTGDTGVEADWQFSKNWAAGIRYDYIFNAGTRTVATRGSVNTVMPFPTTASTDTSLFSFTIRCAVPRT